MKLSEFIKNIKFWILISVLITIINFVHGIMIISRQEDIADSFAKSSKDIHRMVRDQASMILLIQQQLETDIKIPSSMTGWYLEGKK